MRATIALGLSLLLSVIIAAPASAEVVTLQYSGTFEYVGMSTISDPNLMAKLTADFASKTYSMTFSYDTALFQRQPLTPFYFGPDNSYPSVPQTTFKLGRIDPFTAPYPGTATLSLDGATYTTEFPAISVLGGGYAGPGNTNAFMWYSFESSFAVPFNYYVGEGLTGGSDYFYLNTSFKMRTPDVDAANGTPPDAATVLALFGGTNTNFHVQGKERAGSGGLPAGSLAAWDNSITSISVNGTVASVPEPASVLLLGLGCIVVAGLRRRLA